MFCQGASFIAISVGFQPEKAYVSFFASLTFGALQTGQFETELPFVRIHSGNNSKIIFLCVCICYGIKSMSKIVFICYAASSKLQRTAASVSATKE